LRIEDGPPELTPAPIRIDVWRATKALLLALILPVTAAVAIDLGAGTLPVLTIAAAIICIPLGTILVNRTVLSEFDRVIALVAPLVDPEAEAEREPEPGLEAEPQPAAALELAPLPAMDSLPVMDQDAVTLSASQNHHTGARLDPTTRSD